MALLLPNYPLPRVFCTVLPSTMLACIAGCAGKGSIRYGVCLPHFIPPLAPSPSLGLPGFGLQASGFPISITNLSESPTILDSADFCLEKVEVIPSSQPKTYKMFDDLCKNFLSGVGEWLLTKGQGSDDTILCLTDMERTIWELLLS